MTKIVDDRIRALEGHIKYRKKAIEGILEVIKEYEKELKELKHMKECSRR